MTDPDDQTDLGPMPEAEIEPGEVNPGGVDAVPESNGVEAQPDEVLARDLDPELNPAVENALPEEVKQGEDTSTEATEASADDQGDDATANVTSEEESPA